MNIERTHPKKSVIKCQVKYLSTITTPYVRDKWITTTTGWEMFNMTFITSGELWNKLDSAESFSRKGAAFSGSPTVAASCPASHINSLTVWNPSLQSLPCFFFFSFRQALHCHSYGFQMLSPLWYRGDKIIRLGSTVEVWGIILEHHCKSEPLTQSSRALCWNTLTATVSGSYWIEKTSRGCPPFTFFFFLLKWRDYSAY